MSISSEWPRIKASKPALRTSIQNKGVTVPESARIDEYSGYVDLILQDGSTVVPKDINFYDYGGSLVAAWTFADAQNAIELPSGPSHARLVFQNWNWSLTDIKALTMPMNIGATYVTASGKSEFDIMLTPITGLSVTMAFYNNTSGGLLTIDWGDGTVESASTTTTGIKTFTHEYLMVGNYTVSVDSTGTYYPYGSSTAPYNMFNTLPLYICTAIRLGARCNSIGQYAFRGLYNVDYITIPNNVTLIDSYAIYGCNSLTTIVLPLGTTSLNAHVLRYCLTLKNVLLPASVTSIGNYSLDNCTSLRKFFIASTVTQIVANAFSNNSQLRDYIIHRSTPPSLGSSTVFTGINGICKIQVPVGSGALYKAATNWAALSNHIVEWE